LVSVLPAPGSEPTYTVDWTSRFVHVWAEVFAPWRAQAKRILEIGAFEGRTTRWLLEALPLATVTTVDTFEGGDDQQALDLTGLRERFKHNVSPYADRVTMLIGRSDDVLPQLLAKHQRFDFIYVDGSHRSSDVIFDAVCAFRLLPIGGVICFDDYDWTHDGYQYQDRPKYAVDAFVSMYAHQVTVCRQPDIQCWVERVA